MNELCFPCEKHFYILLETCKIEKMICRIFSCLCFTVFVIYKISKFFIHIY
uniref:Uncharacterized protein n=1 Tax=Anguilla anguilla TaxID=7936 RepID=A0A0E9PMR8_ANGAN